jgi:hypothetical protein
MMTSQAPVTGDQVICADGVVLGTVEADEGSHLRLRRAAQPPVIWVAKTLIASAEDGAVHLLLPRDDLHDGIIALPPARQREFGTLEALSLLVRRAREAGRI